jgi:protein required for attachment to host cells
MPEKRITWFCVADAGHVRVKDATIAASPMPTVATLRHEPYEHGRYEGPPTTQESASSARHGLSGAEGPVRHEKREFAHVVADYLNKSGQQGKYQRLILAAPPKFLGDLRAALDAKTRATIAGEIHKDLTKESDAELVARMTNLAGPGG